MLYSKKEIVDTTCGVVFTLELHDEPVIKLCRKEVSFYRVEVVVKLPREYPEAWLSGFRFVLRDMSLRYPYWKFGFQYENITAFFTVSQIQALETQSAAIVQLYGVPKKKMPNEKTGEFARKAAEKYKWKKYGKNRKDVKQHEAI